MMQNVKKSVAEFRLKYCFNNISKESLCNALDKLGYTVIFFNKIINDANVSKVIANLKLEDIITNQNGFTYANEKYRLVFVNKDLSEEECVMVLAHEAGHICLDHLACNSILGNDVKQEHEANEFAHYLLHPSMRVKTRDWIKKHKKFVIILCTCALIVAVGTAVLSEVAKEQSYYGNYYVTDTGNKYHRKECIFVKNKDNVRRLTKEEFESGEYNPCKTCLP